MGGGLKPSPDIVRVTRIGQMTRTVVAGPTVYGLVLPRVLILGCQWRL